MVFSELNDAEDQAARFKAQVARKERVMTKRCSTTRTTWRALEYGMPPTAGLA